MNIHIPGIDTEKAIKNSGSLELFTELLGDVYKLIDEKTSLVETYLNENDIQNYTVLVHSLKTTCRMIGAMDLGEDFFTLEKLGKENNAPKIKELTPSTLSAFKALKPYLEPYAQNDSVLKNAFDKNAVSELLNKLIAAIDDFDLGTAEETTKALLSYNCNNDISDKMKTLEHLVSNLDYDEAKEVSKQILDIL